MITNDSKHTPEKQLRNLRDKAELCRYAHSRLHDCYVSRQRWVVIYIATVSFIMALRVFGYLPEFSDWKEMMTVIGIVLSASILLVQTLSYSFHWKEKEIEHATSLSIWSRWIHKARFFQRNLSEYSDKEIAAKIEQI